MRHDRLVALLERAGLGPLKRSGAHDYALSCLYPHKHAHGDRKPSATVSFDQGVSWFRCWGCGTRRPIALALMETAAPGSGVASLAAAYLADEEQEERTTGPERIMRRLTRQEPARDCTAGLRRLLVMNETYPDMLQSFLAAKGVTESTARRFGVVFMPAGWSDEFLAPQRDGSPGVMRSPAVFVPTLVRHATGIICVGGQARPLDGHGPKYFAAWPFKAGQYLYGQHHWAKLIEQRVFLVEGAFDVQHCWQHDVPALGLFGVGLTAERIAKLVQLHPAHIGVFLDPDPAGRNVTDARVEELRAAGLTASAVLHDKQPKHCSQEELRQLMNSL